MAHIRIDESRCKGCLLCVGACPLEILALSARRNPAGYRVAEVQVPSAAQCTGCASCALLCPDVAIRVWRGEEEEVTHD